jgi:hypothetical protein
MAVSLSPIGGAGWQFFDNNGSPLAGGKLYTYLAGTTTPATTYTTFAGNIAWTNPIVLDAAGRVSGSGEIWLTVGVSYKFVLRDSTDVLIGTYDNILGGIDSSTVTYQPAGTGAVTTTVQAKLRQFPSVKDFGAVGDGITNDTASIVAALAAANSIYFPSGTYLVSGNINIQNKTLFGDSWRNTIIQLSGTNTNTPVFINSANSASPWGTGAGFTLTNLNVRGNWDGSTANPVSINDFNNLGSIVRWYAGSYVNVTNCLIFLPHLKVFS